MQIDIKADFKELQKGLDDFKAREIPAAASRALNRAATTVRAQAVDEIRKVFTVKQAAARAVIRVINSNPKSLIAIVRASGKRLSLSDFSTKQTPAGVVVQVRKDSSPKLIPHTFIVKGRKGVWLRVVPGTQKTTETYRRGRAKGYRARDPKKNSDLPVSLLRAISMPKAMVSDKVEAALRKVARKRFRTEFEREIAFRRKRALERAKGAVNG